MDPVVLLFAKVPRSGDVKTRLIPPLKPGEAARLYTAFLRDTVRTVVQLEADVRLYLAPPLPEKEMVGIPPDVRIREQQGETLGERMKRAFQETFDTGADRILLIGTDHPTLPPSFIRRAAVALDEPHSVSIGPTDDGGFYLLGMNAFFPELFQDMSYGHSNVFSETLSRLGRTDATLTVLPRWYDVDRPEDLEQLCANLATDPATAPNSRRVIERLEVQDRL